jgi:hypothetical protein
MRSSTGKYVPCGPIDALLTCAQTELYTYDWKYVNLQGSLVAGASSGGAIGTHALSPLPLPLLAS